MMRHPADRPGCNCRDPATCHDPESHEDPNPPALCCDCQEIEVGGEAERCAECLLAYAEWVRPPNPTRWEPDTLEEARGER